LNFFLDEEDKRAFLLVYGHGRFPFGTSPDACLERIDGSVRRMVRRRQRSRAKRCLKQSTTFTIDRQPGLLIFRRRDIPRDEIMTMIGAHRETVDRHPQRLLKNSPRTAVSLIGTVGANGRRVCVKSYRHDTGLDSWKRIIRVPKGRRAWTVGNLLVSRGLCSGKPLAYVERRKYGILFEGLYITESVAEDRELDRYLLHRFQDHSGHEWRRFIQAFGRWVGSLHRAGIYHRDLKTCNILVREEAGKWRFTLIDLEDVAFEAAIGIERIVRNLVQINCSVPKSISVGDRLRFLNAYLEVNPVSLEKRGFVKRVYEESRMRGIVYVSPEGDVFEKF
jgi:hypothetical protein